MKSILNVKIKYSVSKGVNTCGYPIFTAIDVKTKKKLACCNGGGYDIWNMLLCNIICNVFQEDLIEKLKGVDLTESSGSHPFYCISRTEKGRIHANGGGGSGVTSTLAKILGLTIQEFELQKDLWFVQFLQD